ncbi:MAG: hypothetical protein M5U09_03640 [Gammaproteobacteria bacterium]|nr:hypothetical protein [Gammaproteobacteria bacterium]
MVLAMTYNTFPFLLFTTHLAMKMVDSRQLAAARDLGASPAGGVLARGAALAAPGIVTGAVLVFVPTLSAVLEPELLGGTSSRLMATAIRDQFFHARNWPLGATLTILLIVAGGLAIGILAAAFAWATRAIGRIRPGRRNGRMISGRHPWLASATLALLVFALTPLATVMVFSVNDSRFYAFPLRGFSLQWYRELFADERILQALASSTGIAAAVTVVATILGTAFAFVVVRGIGRLWRVASAVGFLPLVVPVLVLAAAPRWHSSI